MKLNTTLTYLICAFAFGWLPSIVDARGNHVKSVTIPKSAVLIASVDLKGEPREMDLSIRMQKAPLAEGVAPVWLYSDQKQFVLQDVKTGAILWKEFEQLPPGTKVQTLKIRFVQGKTRWLDLQVTQHVLPNPGDKEFMPGPPLVILYMRQKDGVFRTAN